MAFKERSVHVRNNQHEFTETHQRSFSANTAGEIFYKGGKKYLAKTKTFIMASFSLQTVDIFPCLDHFHARFNLVSVFV